MKREDYRLSIRLDFFFSADPEKAQDEGERMEKIVRRLLDSVRFFTFTGQEPTIGEGILKPLGATEREEE